MDAWTCTTANPQHSCESADLGLDDAIAPYMAMFVGNCVLFASVGSADTIAAQPITSSTGSRIELERRESVPYGSNSAKRRPTRSRRTSGAATPKREWSPSESPGNEDVLIAGDPYRSPSPRPRRRPSLRYDPSDRSFKPKSPDRNSAGRLWQDPFLPPASNISSSPRLPSRPQTPSSALEDEVSSLKSRLAAAEHRLEAKLRLERAEQEAALKLQAARAELRAAQRRLEQNGGEKWATRSAAAGSTPRKGRGK